MTRYLLSVHSREGGEVREPMTEEQMRQSHARLGDIEREMATAGAWVFSGRLHEPDTATVVRVSDGELLTTDGPFAESKDHLGGFYVNPGADRGPPVRRLRRRADGLTEVVEEAVVGRIFREESGRSVAAVIGFCGDIDVAEDAVQEAFAIALRKWPEGGLPPNPGGWITTTARNRAIDRLRRDARGRELFGDMAAVAAQDDLGEVDAVPDDRLRLIFTCCHPALAGEVRVALTLRLLGGLSTTEVARAFLVAEPAMAQRLVRAKRKIKAARIPYRIPAAEELPGRLRSVLAVIYLVYTTGLTRPGLCAEAIRLARILAGLMPDEPEVAGLLALVLLVESRRATRTRPDGSLVLLVQQDRAGGITP